VEVYLQYIQDPIPKAQPGRDVQVEYTLAATDKGHEDLITPDCLLYRWSEDLNVSIDGDFQVSRLILIQLFYQIHDGPGLVHQFFIKRFDFLAGDRFHVKSRPFDLVQ